MIRRFFTGLWHALTVTKNALGNLIFLLFIALVLMAVFSGEVVTMPERTALVIDPTGIIVEQKKIMDPLSGFLSGYDDEASETALRDITEAIEQGANDDRIKALVFRLDRMQGAGLSKLEEIAISVNKFKQSGKPVLAFSNSYSQGQYYLASMADKIYINETSFPVFSGVFLTGIGTYPLYYKSALDKLNIDYNIYKVGTYKSAVEPYLRDDMSEDAKLANRDWLDALWSNYRSHIIEQRGISESSFDDYTNKYDQLLATTSGDGNLLAVQQDMVDDLLSNADWDNMMIDIVGESGDSFNQTHFLEYLQIVRPPIPVVNPATNKIAVVTASGVILNGDQPPGDIGSKTAVSMIDQARLDDSVKAIVLRVDSPGGSATAAEEIRVALVEAKAAGKPVVVSMGSAAASGGYWISAPANKIFANSNTITGSIGTFITFPNFKGAANHLGVYSDGVGTTTMSNIFNPLDDVSDVLDNLLQMSVNQTYQRFLGIVADGREMTMEQADTLAQGRVWAAEDALEHGLIDAIGTLDDAIDSAALLADLASYDVLYIEQPLSTRDRILREILKGSTNVMHQVLGKDYRIQLSFLSRIESELSILLKMSQEPGVYLQCLECDTKL